MCDKVERLGNVVADVLAGRSPAPPDDAGVRRSLVLEADAVDEMAARATNRQLQGDARRVADAGRALGGVPAGAGDGSPDDVMAALRAVIDDCSSVGAAVAIDR